MADDIQQPAAGATAAQPASGSTPAADPNKAPADAKPGDKAGDERLAIRERAITAERERDAAKAQAADLAAKVKAFEDAKLAAEGKFQDLAKSKETEAGEWKLKWESERRTNALLAAGAKADAKDVADLLPFAKLDGIDVSNTTALREAAEKSVAELMTAKPYLFGKSAAGDGKQPPATPFPTPQANPGGGQPFDLSKVTADDIRSGKLTPEQVRAVAGSGSRVDFLGRKVT